MENPFSFNPELAGFVELDKGISHNLQIVTLLSRMDLPETGFDKDPPPFPADISFRAFVDLILKPYEEDFKIWLLFFKQ